ncbi:hypothetical protein OROMI_015633 [Orobanche minor]
MLANAILSLYCLELRGREPEKENSKLERRREGYFWKLLQELETIKQ